MTLDTTVSSSHIHATYRSQPRRAATPTKAVRSSARRSLPFPGTVNALSVDRICVATGIPGCVADGKNGVTSWLIVDWVNAGCEFCYCRSKWRSVVANCGCWVLVYYTVRVSSGGTTDLSTIHDTTMNSMQASRRVLEHSLMVSTTPIHTHLAPPLLSLMVSRSAHRVTAQVVFPERLGSLAGCQLCC